MSTLIEDLYCKEKVNIIDFLNTKISNLTYFEKVVLGINDFNGYKDNTIIDVCFVNRIPIQIMYYKYKFIKRY